MARKNISKKTLTANQQAYQRELRKLKRRIYTQKKKGYKVDEEKLIPKKPKRIGKEDIAKLKGIRAKQIKEVSEAPERYDEYVYEDYIADVLELIDNLPQGIQLLTGTRKDYKIINYSLEGDKYFMRSLLWDTANSYDDVSQYNAYLKSVYSQLQALLNPDYLPSTEDELKDVLSQAFRLIKGSSLTMSEAIRLEEIEEMF